MVRIKSIILAAALAAFFSPVAQASPPFAQIIPLKTLCVFGSPEPLLMKLKEQYNEVPKYSMKISVASPLPIVMIVTENRSNPSSTVVLVNANLNMSCIFFTAKDHLKDTGADTDLPAKQPMEEDGKLEA
jgi:hypothetical protein